jgi:hypothetical protein
MKPLFRGRPKLFPNRAEKVFGIKKAVHNGTYEIDSANLANILIKQLLNYSTQFHRLSLKGH